MGIIEYLANTYGIDINATKEQKLEMLQVMDVVPSNDLYSKEEFEALLSQKYKEVRDAEFSTIMSPVNITRENRQNVIELSLPENLLSKRIMWQIFQENGDIHKGVADVNDMEPSLDKNGYEQTHEINGVIYKKYAFKKPDNMDFGYHKLNIKTSDGREQTSDLFHCPQKCYEPPVIANGGKIWGMPVQDINCVVLQIKVVA